MAKFNFNQTVEPENKDQLEVCPVLYSQNIIAGRWKLVILWQLIGQTQRFSALQKHLPMISKGILTRHLRELEDDGMIHRKVYQQVPPKVEYSLTQKGEDFIPILYMMREWSEKYATISKA